MFLVCNSKSHRILINFCSLCLFKFLNISNINFRNNLENRVPFFLADTILLIKFKFSVLSCFPKCKIWFYLRIALKQLWGQMGEPGTLSEIATQPHHLWFRAPELLIWRSDNVRSLQRSLEDLGKGFIAFHQQRSDFVRANVRSIMNAWMALGKQWMFSLSCCTNFKFRIHRNGKGNFDLQTNSCSNVFLRNSLESSNIRR